MTEVGPYSVESERATAASIEFVFCNHSEGNLGRVADAVLASDGDIIAIEKIREGSFGMGTSEEKTRNAERMTDFVAAGHTSPLTAREYFHTDEPFFTKLLDGLKGSGKRIVLLDIGTDDEGYTHYQNSQTARHAHNDSVKRGEPNEDLYLDFQIASAQANEYREYTMANQLEAVAQANPGLKITVMAGAAHTPLSHDLGSKLKTTRIFVPTEEDAATYARGEKMRYCEPWSDVRAIRFNLASIGLSTLDETEGRQPTATE